MSNTEDCGLKPIRDVLINVNDHVISLFNSRTAQIVSGVPTGFTDLDYLTAGLHPGELIVISGGTSMGKTSFSLNIAEYVAMRAGMPIAIFSTELTAKQVSQRLISSYKNIPLKNLRNGQLKGDELQRMGEAITDIANSRNVFIDDSASFSVSEVCDRARELNRTVKQLGLIVIDNIHMLKCEEKAESRAVELSNITTDLKALAKELSCPIISTAHINRNVDDRFDKRPIIGDIRDSCTIEQTADVVIFLYRDVIHFEEIKGTDDERNAEAIIRKQRNGQTGTIDLTFFGEYCHFKNRARN